MLPEACLGIMPGFGRGIPPGRGPAEPPGRGMRVSLDPGAPAGRVVPAASGRGPGRRTPMPCDGAYGLLPGLGAPGRRLAVLGEGAPGRGPPGRGAAAAAGRGEALGAGGRGAGDAGRGVDVVGVDDVADGSAGDGSTGAGSGDGVCTTGRAAGAGAGVAAAGLGRAAGAVGAAAAATGRLGAATGAGAAVAWGAGALAATDFSRTLRTTGASSVDEADRTNSPMSLSVVSKSLLSSPSSLASSQTRTLAMISFRSGAQRVGTGLVGGVAHCGVLIEWS
jgi:hypothetical protein